MNLICKKFISLFLVLSLLMLSVNLHAKERRGATLIVTKTDGQQIEGELITVKHFTSLLLLDTEGKDVSVGVVDIREIKIVKKNTAGKGALIGALIGAVGGAFVIISQSGEVLYGSLGIAEVVKALIWGLIFGTPGALLGAIIGGIAGTDKILQIEGMTDLEIKEALNYLREKARIRDYK